MKRLLLSIDNHFSVTSDGQYWSHSIVDNLFWNKYLEVFDEVYCFVRVQKDDFSSVKNYIKFNNPRVKIIEIPMFRGISNLMSNYKEIKTIIRNSVINLDYKAALIRIPSILGFLVYDELKRIKYHPIGVEVVGNMAPKKTDHLSVMSVKKRYFHQRIKTLVKNTDGASYVTRFALQEIYPSHPHAVTNYYSSIDLSKDYFYQRAPKTDKHFKFLHVSTLNANSKGHDVFFDIIKQLILQGYDVEATVVGGGVLKGKYEKHVKNLDIDQYVSFIGNIASKQQLREIYCHHDILLFPTEYEGLPRCVIEAMATSMVCVTSNVDGLPELVESSYMFDPKATSDYVNACIKLMTNPTEFFRVSQRNYEKAFEYEKETLQKRRNSYFEELMEK